MTSDHLLLQENLHRMDYTHHHHSHLQTEQDFADRRWRYKRQASRGCIAEQCKCRWLHCPLQIDTGIHQCLIYESSIYDQILMS